MRSSNRKAIVRRNYEPSTPDCTRAVELLLKTAKKAVELRAGLDSCDGNQLEEDSASGYILPR